MTVERPGGGIRETYLVMIVFRNRRQGKGELDQEENKKSSSSHSDTSYNWNKKLLSVSMIHLT
jgi:hypothetical protein